MDTSFIFALAQLNLHVGCTTVTVTKIGGFYELAAAAGAHLVIFSEMAVTGYPPEDLVYSSLFQKLSMEAIEELAALTAKNNAAMVVGGLWCEDGKLYNTLFLLEGGKIVHRQYKYHLPNYGVFDEKRVFAHGPMPEPVAWRGLNLGLMICEDMWQQDVAAHLKAQGAHMLITVNASPYEIGKAERREAIAAERVKETGLPLVYVNQICGQDDLVFDGSSFVLDGSGKLCLRLQAFKEDLSLLGISKGNGDWKYLTDPVQLRRGLIHPLPDELESIYAAMMLALRDFVEKNGYKGVVIGISGGIDSVLSSVIAADALGSDKVHMIMLPSPVTSQESKDDAAELAKRLGVRMDIFPIESGIKAFQEMMGPYVDNEYFEVAVANNQARIRGSILVAISTLERALLLTTGNKSEIATGFMSLYADMCGYYNVLKDIYKTKEYELARWRNTISDVIPEYSITRPPSGETMPNQKDEDQIPPYPILDQILYRMVEQQQSMEDVIAAGFDPEMVEVASNRLFGSEYKRRQSAPGLKLTSMAFGRDRRYPISSVWRAKKLKLPA